MEEGAVARLSEIWPQRFGGPNRAGLPMFSRGPVEVHDLTPNFQELQLTSLRAYERDIIVSVFGVPPELVGILANSNRATIESAEFLFTKHVIKPRLMARAAAINDQLAPQYDADLYAVFDDPVDEDVEARRAYMGANRWAFTVDEHRAAAGTDALPDGAGKRFPMSFSDVFADHAPAVPEADRAAPDTPADVAPVSPAATAPGGGDEVQASALNGAQIQALQQIVQSVADGQLPPETAVQLIMIGFPTIDDTTARAIVNPAVGFSPAGEGKGAASRMGVTKAATVKTPDDAMGAIPDDWFEPSLTSAYRSTVTDFAAAALADIGVEIAFDVFDPVVSEWISTMAAERSKLIVGATRDSLRVTLSEGVAAGESTGDLVKRIRATVTDASAGRARTIARTEIVQASNFATTEAHREAGIEEREWLATADNEVRDAHVEVDGQVRGIDEPFEVNGAQAMYPGGFGVAELDINCIPGDALVRGEFVLGLKSFYAGEVIEIETASGARLTVTPNHPVLTLDGFVPAHNLREGQYAIRDIADTQHAGRKVGEDVDASEACAADVFEALGGGSLSMVANCRVEDFDGDGAGVHDGEVEIVSTDRHLLENLGAALAQSGRDVRFRGAGAAALGECPADRLGLANDAPDRSGVSGLVLPGAGGGVHSAPLEPFRVGLTATGHASIAKCARDGGPLEAELGGDAQFTHAGNVEPGDFIAVEVGSPVAAQDHAARAQLSADVSDGSAKGRCQDGDTLARLVSADRIIEVKRGAFSGHVYDFQTVSGAMVAQGIVIHNCRCAVLPKFPNEITGAKRKAAWLKVEGGRASHERALEAALVRDFAALSERIAAALEG